MGSPSQMCSRLTVQRLTESVVAGNVVKEWQELGKRWCSIEWTGATETDKATARTATFTVRADSVTKAVSEKDRIVYDGNPFAVTAWLPIPAGRPDIIKISATFSPV